MKKFKKLIRSPILFLINVYIRVTGKVVITGKEYRALLEDLFFKDRYKALKSKYDFTLSMLIERMDEVSELKKELKEQRNRPAGGVTIDDDALDDLIKLCHPDKHNGCEEANNITQQLLDIRSKRRKAKKR